MTSWKRLLTLLPPPKEVRGLDRSWETVESKLGVALPGDYKKFVDTYGSGCIMPSGGEVGSIIIWNLRGVPDVMSWVLSATRRYDTDRNSGNDLPYKGYPEPSGLLGWGTTPEGDFFNWRMIGEPEEWDCVFYHFSNAQMIVLEGMQFTDVLVELLEHESSLMPYPIDPDNLKPPCAYTEEVW